jgi:hypothetical protein
MAPERLLQHESEDAAEDRHHTSCASPASKAWKNLERGSSSAPM